MTMNILAILISLAMMLTGAGAEGQPAEASRTLTLHNISLTYNGETIELAPALTLGASTDGEKAVFDVGVSCGDETLFPMQLGVNEDGLTVLSKSEDVAVRISAKAFDDLTEQLNATIQALTEQAQAEMDGDDQVMNVLMNDFIPAYVAIIEAVQDESFVERIEEASRGLIDEVVDRGEGTPVSEMIEGESYELTAYAYTIEGAQMAEMADKLYTLDDTLADYYNALFKLYDCMPEESGLKGLSSFAELFERFNLDMKMDVSEKVSEDGDVEIMDAVLTLDMNGMIAAAMEAEQGEGEEPAEIPAIEPMVMNIHGVTVDDVNTVELTCDYAVEDVNISMGLDGHSEGMDDVNLAMNMLLVQGGEQIGNLQMNLEASTDEDTGDANYFVDYSLGAAEDQMRFTVSGTNAADGTAHSSVDVAADMEGNDFELAFDLDVTNAPIEDVANGHEAYQIDDLSEESLQALTEDSEFMGNMMKAVGSLTVDAQKLTQDESVMKLLNLFAATQEPTYSYEDGSFEDGENLADDSDNYEYEEPEDDGELGFGMPEFTWLPEGWSVSEVNTDTAYDMVDVQLVDKDQYICGYAIFYATEDDSLNYIIDSEGSVSQVEGREVNVTNYGDEGGLYIGMSDGGVYSNISIYDGNIDMETVGKIIAGLQFTE